MATTDANAPNTVVLIHGLWMTPRSWENWVERYKTRGFNVMALGIWYEAIMRWAGEAIRVRAMGKTFVRMRRDASGTMRPS